MLIAILLSRAETVSPLTLPKSVKTVPNELEPKKTNGIARKMPVIASLHPDKNDLRASIIVDIIIKKRVHNKHPY